MPAFDSYDDVELIALLKKDDLDAFTAIHNRYYGVLYSHIYRRLGDRDEVKDLLQELFTCVWNKRNALSPEINLQAYLYTAARNRVLNIFKHQKIKNDYISSFQKFAYDGDPTPDETFRLKELITLINAEVSALPPQMRLIFEMSRNANLSHNEIAEQLNLSPLTVKKQVNNSLRILRLKLHTHIFMLLF